MYCVECGPFDCYLRAHCDDPESAAKLSLDQIEALLDT